MRASLSIVCALSLFIASCGGAGGDVTQVMLEVRATPGVLARDPVVNVQVFGATAGGTFMERLNQNVLDSDTWPLRIALVPAGKDATRRFQAIVTATDGGTVIAVARATSGYIEGRVLLLTVLLSEVCGDCGAGLTCDGSACVSSTVEPTELPDYEPGTCSMVTYYRDVDTDGFGDPADSLEACSPPAGYVSNGTDCNDACAECEPGGTEVCDDRDNDCDTRVDEDLSRACGTDVGACMAGTETCTGGAFGACEGEVAALVDELCDGIEDDDCDGSVDEGCACTTGETESCGTNVGTCTEGTRTCNGSVFGPCSGVGMESEVCDGADNDCNGVVDNGFACQQGASVSCSTSCGTVGTGACTSGCQFPTAASCTPPAETCDAIDQDCDGRIDEGTRVLGAAVAGSGTTLVSELEVVATSSGFAVTELRGTTLVLQVVDLNGQLAGAALTVATGVAVGAAASSVGDDVYISYGTAPNSTDRVYHAQRVGVTTTGAFLNGSPVNNYHTAGNTFLNRPLAAASTTRVLLGAQANGTPMREYNRALTTQLQTGYINGASGHARLNMLPGTENAALIDSGSGQIRVQRVVSSGGVIIANIAGYFVGDRAEVGSYMGARAILGVDGTQVGWAQIDPNNTDSGQTLTTWSSGPPPVSERWAGLGFYGGMWHAAYLQPGGAVQVRSFSAASVDHQLATAHNANAGTVGAAVHPSGVMLIAYSTGNAGSAYRTFGCP
ncbi:MAG: putative metal-binding motif-containing protein [Myxococcales bacterium]|nr:putative metal-binding motif-containing protein [Myxococcales bacterium]MCB9626993.1 putative metal-binding motif-containing protein [Sandaracinaceae bacterium]